MNKGKGSIRSILLVNILQKISASGFTREISLQFLYNLFFRFWCQDDAGLLRENEGIGAYSLWRSVNKMALRPECWIEFISAGAGTALEEFPLWEVSIKNSVSLMDTRQ